MKSKICQKTEERIRKCIIELKFPEEAWQDFAHYPYPNFSNLDLSTYNSVLVETHIGLLCMQQKTYCYRLLNIGDYLKAFKLPFDARKVTLEVKDGIVSEFENVKKDVWYNLYREPISIYALPLDDGRFLKVDYLENDDSKASFNHILVSYITVTNEKIEDVVNASKISNE